MNIKHKLWHRMKLRGRLLTLMLTVSITVILICTGCFIYMNQQMLDKSKKDTQNLSSTVHLLFNSALNQQFTYLQNVYTYEQSAYVDSKLANSNDYDRDWDALIIEAYDLVNDRDHALLDSIQFIWINGELYTYGDNCQNLFQDAEAFFEHMEKYESFENDGFLNTLLNTGYGSLYTSGENGQVIVWAPFAEGDGRIGLFLPNTQVTQQSQALQEMMSVATNTATDNMTEMARKLVLIFIIVIVGLIILLPLASKRLAHIVVDSVEQERERQDAKINMMVETDKMKTQFYQNMHHDMKTPLHVINTDIQNADDMLDYDIDKATVQEKLANAQQEIIRLARMLENSLDIASAQINSHHMEKFNLAEVLLKKSKMFHSLLEKNGNILKLNIPEYLPEVYGNQDMLVEVIFNIMYNAHTHTQNGTITVTLTQKDTMLCTEIRDTGFGIAPEILPNVFERGVSTTGSGYGLAICKTIIEMHHGEIHIESKQSEGTAVTFTVPIEEKK